ncbi:MAG: thiamine-phosphate kinase [Phycisphaerae bacterium]|nr:thiamine-phosphate kinase [Gemmatimonadaceae bacterium]
MTHTPLGPGHEFDHIRGLLDLWGPLADGIGDDAAILTPPAGEQLVVSTDSTVEGVHFRREWMTPHEIGARGATAALSDIAAMGASAHGVLVSLVVPDPWRKLVPDFARGIGVSVGAAGARIVGGNIAWGQTFSATFTVVGFAKRPLRRSGASPGDVLYVTGTLGGPKAALSAWERGDQPDAQALQRFRHPVARLAEGQWLAARGACAMIDISDGLAADARHLGAASGVLPALTASLVPRFSFVTPEDALTSGEEYELLVSLPPALAEEIATSFEHRFALPLTRVGHVEAVPDETGQESNSPPRVELAGGHDHFSR